MPGICSSVGSVHSHACADASPACPPPLPLTQVAIPAVDGKGRATLALDFGRFTIESDFEASARLPAEESQLYHCVRLSVSDVAAYVADGQFDWQHARDPVRRAGAGHAPVGR